MATVSEYYFPHVPTNPRSSAAIQAGVKKNDHLQFIIPPGCIVFSKKQSESSNEIETTGRGINKVPVGYHNSTYPALDPDETPNDEPELFRVMGVSMDGIIDPSAARDNKESCGRYAVAVSGLVTLTVVLEDGTLPPLLSTLYVSAQRGNKYLQYCGSLYFLPKFSTTKHDDTYRKVGTIHWVNDKFKTDKIAEVRVMLNLFD